MDRRATEDRTQRSWPASRRAPRGRGIALLLLTAALILPVPLFGQTGGAAPAPVPKAVDGTIDLRSWDLAAQGPVALDGNWLFSWERFSVSGGGEPGSGTGRPASVKVPAVWNSYGLPAAGYGTFRVEVLLGRNYRSLSIQLSGICTSYNLYVNGRKIASEGNAAISAAGQIPMVTDRVISFAPQSERILVQIEVSNFVHRRGGITDPVYIGTDAALDRRHAAARETDFLLIGAFFIMGIYHLGLFLLRRQERSLLYFALFCLLTVLRIYVTSGYSTPPFGGLLPWRWLMRIEYFTLTLGFPVFLLYVHALYRKEFDSRARNVVLALSGLYTLLVLFFPAMVYGRALILFQGVILATSLYVYWVLYLALRRRRSSARIFLVAYTIFFLGVLNDILANNRWIATPDVFPIALFVFILFQAVLLGARFARVYRQVEYLTRMQSQLRTANQSLRELSYVDPLTGVANRRHFDEFIRQEWARGIRNSTPLSLLMVDIDGFKAYNDNYGHQAGDEVLRRVASELSRAVRRSVDFLARYGGEEFVVVLPNTTSRGAFRVAEKLRAAVQALHIPHAYSGVASVLTISVGVA
ncbi:sensor domain-containing diguanylate cyclase, partial [Salinispira pacifica]